MPPDARRPTNPAGYRTAAGWVSAVLDVARPHGQPPRYGTPEHLALAPSSPLFVAAVAIAAQAWYDENGTRDAIAARLRLELDAHARAEDACDTEDFATMAAGVRRIAAAPSMAELATRRHEPERAARARAHAVEMRAPWPDAPDGAA